MNETLRERLKSLAGAAIRWATAGLVLVGLPAVGSAQAKATDSVNNRIEALRARMEEEVQEKTAQSEPDTDSVAVDPWTDWNDWNDWNNWKNV